MNPKPARSPEHNQPLDLLAQLHAQVCDDPDDRALLRRWERLSVAVRCALNADEANAIRLYIASGQRLLNEGIGTPLVIYQRMLHTLLRTADDDALPMAWRLTCAEHFDVPIARLKSLADRLDQSGNNGLIEQAVAVRNRLHL